MKISKALKMKNRLAGDIAVLKQRITENNVAVVDRGDSGFDVMALYENFQKATESLVAIKTAIAMANGGNVVNSGSVGTVNAYRIYKMAELKGMIEMLRNLDTRNGKFNEGTRFGDVPIVTEYRATISRSKADEMIVGLTDQIESLQDDTDAFNATAEINID